MELFDFEKDEHDPDYRTVTVATRRRRIRPALENSCIRSLIPPISLISGRSDICTNTLRRAEPSIELKEMGVEDGDTIRIDDYEFEYFDEDYFED